MCIFVPKIAGLSDLLRIYQARAGFQGYLKPAAFAPTSLLSSKFILMTRFLC